GLPRIESRVLNSNCGLSSDQTPSGESWRKPRGMNLPRSCVFSLTLATFRRIHSDRRSLRSLFRRLRNGDTAGQLRATWDVGYGELGCDVREPGVCGPQLHSVDQGGGE